MVVTCLPLTRERGETQERIARPSRWTVQAPQSAMPQPNLVPVSPRESRKIQRKATGKGYTEKRIFPSRDCGPWPRLLLEEVFEGLTGVERARRRNLGSGRGLRRLLIRGRG